MTRNALGRGLGALIREPEPSVAPQVTPQVNTNQQDQPMTTPAGQRLRQRGTEVRRYRSISTSLNRVRSNRVQRFVKRLWKSCHARFWRAELYSHYFCVPVGNRYELIAGERRWRAAQLAGLTKVPAIVREVRDELALEMTLVENIQREDLNPIESARAFDRLITEFQMTPEMVAERTGKDRTTVSNAIRLLKLESTIQEWIEEGKLTAGHGRALLAVPDSPLRMRYAHRASRGGLTVRQIERLAARRARNRVPVAREESDANTRSAIDELQRNLGTKIMLRPHTKTHPGQLIIEFYDEPHLMRLYDQLMK